MNDISKQIAEALALVADNPPTIHRGCECYPEVHATIGGEALNFSVMGSDGFLWMEMESNDLHDGGELNDDQDALDVIVARAKVVRREALRLAHRADCLLDHIDQCTPVEPTE